MSRTASVDQLIYEHSDGEEPIRDTELTLQPRGDSIATALPADWLRYNRLTESDNVRVRAWEGCILITPTEAHDGGD